MSIKNYTITLYSHSKGVGILMPDRIIEYYKGLSYFYRKSAELSLSYYIDYKLTIKGFVKQ